jgi:alpha-1,2-mannosyltransferase
MYAITLAAALVLSGRRQHRATVAVAAFGVLVGWPFAAMAAAPLVVYSLATGGFLQVFCSGLITTICTMVLSVLTDRFFYGRWTSSVLNLVFYNVFSEEGSTLYGVEGPLFYFKNAFNNFNFALPFALLCPLVLLLSSKRKYCKLVLAVSPIFVWLAFMSLQPHKEERSVLFDVSLATELSLLKVTLHSSETQEPVFRLFIHGCCCDATCFLLMLESIPLLTPD